MEENSVVRTAKPKELTPTSHSKEEQMIIKEEDIFGGEKKNNLEFLAWYTKPDIYCKVKLYRRYTQLRSYLH